MAKEVRLHTLRPASGSTFSRKRVGRGQGSGYGGTSTRGHKGAQSRSGYSRKLGFEGGQMPLQRRVPKYGFTNPFRVAYRPINLSDLERIAEQTGVTEITPSLLAELSLIKRNDKVKILGGGEVTRAFTVQAHAISASARSSIEAASGSVSII